MLKFQFMTTDDEFIQLTRLVAEFSLVTQTPFWKNMGECAASFTTPAHLTLLIIGEAEVESAMPTKIEGYLHGYFISPYEFLISQASHRNGEGNEEGFKVVEEVVKSRGCTRIHALTALPPEMFEKYGLKFDRYMLSKDV